jgi:uncharacterized protein YfkK (UPF0435 family)/predicted MPP superfamily phosphohydrolase
MKTIILHLSDLHIRETEDKAKLVAKAEAIAGVLSKHSGLTETQCFLVITGDVAFSGKQAEYVLAKEFLKSLENAAKTHNPQIKIDLIVAPGNHDCDFSTPSSVRGSLLRDVAAAPAKVDDQILAEISKPEDNFFSFLRSIYPDHKCDAANRLSYEHRFHLSGVELSFYCCNTAWMSSVQETQGTLMVPVNLLAKPAEGSKFTITLFHHPYNWFASENGRNFRQAIEKFSDLILTGHEHDIGQVSQKRIGGNFSDYVEGGVLHAADSSSFNLIELDLHGRRRNVIQYVLNGTIYKPDLTTGWEAVQSHHVQNDGFSIAKEFQQYLEDPGVNFTHPRKGTLLLDDVFIYPILKKVNPSSNPKKHSYVDFSDTKKYLLQSKQVVVFGPEQSGKTTLCKRIFRDIFQSGKVPLLIDGGKITAKDCEEARCGKLVERTFLTQYSADALEAYLQLPPDRRVILVDDFDKADLNSTGKLNFLKFLSAFAEKRIVFLNDLVHIGEFLSDKDNLNLFMNFDVCQIRELGHQQREKMLRQWLMLGQEYAINEDALVFEVNKTAVIIDAALRHSIIPAYPVFVLSILQTYEAHTPLTTATASYGYFYEALITTSLAMNWAPQQVDKIYNYLAVLANHLYLKKKRVLTLAEVEEFGEEYYRIYAVRIPAEETLKKLNASRILLTTDAGWRFRYDYLYYYFIARYFRDNLNDAKLGETIKGAIRQMCSELHVENNANILLFFSYLSKDPFIIDEMLAQARLILKEFPPCDLDKSVEFVKKVSISAPQMTFEEQEAGGGRETHLKRKDERLREEEDKKEVEARNARAKAMPSAINSAFKTLEILGQIARNFSGSLKADTKTQLIEESYFIGLRVMSMLLKFFEKNLENLHLMIADFLKEEGGVEDEAERKVLGAQFLFLILEMVVTGLVKKVSKSTGSDDLKEIYRLVLSKNDLLSVQLLNIAVELDHFRTPDYDHVTKFYRANEKNMFIATQMKMLIYEHLTMFPVKRGHKDALCDTMGLVKQNPLLIVNDEKRFSGV